MTAVSAAVGQAHAVLDGIEKAREAATTGPFWERCGCLDGMGRIPSVSDCHQAGLCQMRQTDRERDAEVLRLVAAVRAALALADEWEADSRDALVIAAAGRDRGDREVHRINARHARVAHHAASQLTSTLTAALTEAETNR